MQSYHMHPESQSLSIHEMGAFATHATCHIHSVQCWQQSLPINRLQSNMQGSFIAGPGMPRDVMLCPAGHGCC